MNMREEANSLSLQDTIKLVIVRSGLEAHYNAEKDGEDRIANMREMMSAAAATSPTRVCPTACLPSGPPMKAVRRRFRAF